MAYSEVILTACIIGLLCNLLEASPFKGGEMEGNAFERDSRQQDPMLGRGPGFTRDYSRRGGCFPLSSIFGTGSNSMTGVKENPANFGVTKNNADAMSGKVGTAPGQIMYGTTDRSGKLSGSLDTGSSSSATNTRMVRDVQHPRKFPTGTPGKVGSQVKNAKGSSSMTAAKVYPANFGVTKNNADAMSGKVGTAPGQIMYGTAGGSGKSSGSLDNGSSSSAASKRMVRDVQHPRKFPIGNPGKMGSQVNKPKGSNYMTVAKVNPANFGVTKNNADAMKGKVGTAPGQIMYGTTSGSGKPSGSLDTGSSSSAASKRMIRDVHCHKKSPIGNPGEMGEQVNNKPGGIAF